MGQPHPSLSLQRLHLFEIYSKYVVNSLSCAVILSRALQRSQVDQRGCFTCTTMVIPRCNPRWEWIWSLLSKAAFIANVILLMGMWWEGGVEMLCEKHVEGRIQFDHVVSQGGNSRKWQFKIRSMLS